MLDLVWIYKLLPSSCVRAMMSSHIRRSYNKNEYNTVYRNRDTLTHFEERSIQRFLGSMDSREPLILDLGCGSGKPYDQYLVAHNCRIVGVDISEKQLERARINVPSAQYVNSDLLRYSTDAKYDGIVMLYSLYHVNRAYHQRILEKMYGMLHDDGWILLNIRKEDNPLKYKPDFCGQSMLWSHFDYKTFKKMLRNAGFRSELLGDEIKQGSKESHLWLLLSKQ